MRSVINNIVKIQNGGFEDNKKGLGLIIYVTILTYFILPAMP